MHRWKFSVLAAAAIVSTGLFTADANALALGQIHVRSALGEPLRADIDLPQISAAEAESLKAGTAAPDVYRAQGLEYSSAVNDIRVQFQRRPDGTGVLRLSSSRAINDPFIDLVIDATWASGHIVRSYTMLLDPPELRRNTVPATTAPQIGSQQTPAVTERPYTQPAEQRAQPEVQERRAPAVQPRVAPAPAPARAPASESSGGDVQVRVGETAGRIANAHRPAGVSLDQMLVAMMRSNPNAFINGNVNRLRAGTVLQMPSESQAQATTPGEARKIMAAQSRDFNEFRRRLAGAAPSAEVSAPQRAATGSVQTEVSDQKPATASSDKLTLSKGGVQSQKKDESLARDRQSTQNSERLAELNKNITDLNKLSTAAGTPASPAAAASAASKPAELPAIATLPVGTNTSTVPTVPATTTPVASVPAVVASEANAAASAAIAAASTSVDAASEAVNAASEAASAASVPAPTKPRKIVPPPPPPPEPTFLETITEDPLMLGGAGALLLLLLGYGGYRVAQRRKAALAPSDSSLMDSQLQPDSFFGQSGGQRVDTNNSGMSTGSSSLAYSPSQLDAGEVDPVAEADVYLAYGRDLQAEEILREAARLNPERTSIHVKLAEIYAKRQDRKALEAQAKELHTLTQGQGVDWARVAELGRTQDPENPLYLPSAARPGMVSATAAGLAAAGAAAAASHHLDLDAPSTLPVDFHSSSPAPKPMDMDAGLDLDLDLGTPVPSPAAQNQWMPPTAPAPIAPVIPAPVAAAPLLPDFELPPLSLDTPLAPIAPVAPVAFTPAAPAASNGMDFQLDDLSFNKPSAGAAATAATETAHSYVETTARQPLEFDMNSLSLDLNTQPAPVAPSFTSTAPGALSMSATDVMPLTPSGSGIPEEPLATKLALAEEFNAIGDSEGARTLVEEVIAEASGDLKTRAQQMLAKLG